MFLSFIFWSVIMISFWAFMGAITYAQYHDEIPNPRKKMLFLLICGPFVWILYLIYLTAGAIILGVDDYFVKFIEWLRRP